MTDNEIIKALECCVNQPCCTQHCPYWRNSKAGCEYITPQNLLNLINSQQAKIKGLNKKVEELSEVLSDHIKIRVKEIKSEAIKEFAEKLKAEYDGFDERSEMIMYNNLLVAIDDVVKEMVGENNDIR